MAQEFPNPPSEQPPIYEPPTPGLPTGAEIYPEPPRKTNRTWLIVLIVLLVLCCCCAAFGVIMYNWGGDAILDMFNGMGIDF